MERVAKAMRTAYDCAESECAKYNQTAQDRFDYLFSRDSRDPDHGYADLEYSDLEVAAQVTNLKKIRNLPGRHEPAGRLTRDCP